MGEQPIRAYPEPVHRGLHLDFIFPGADLRDEGLRLRRRDDAVVVEHPAEAAANPAEHTAAVVRQHTGGQDHLALHKGPGHHRLVAALVPLVLVLELPEPDRGANYDWGHHANFLDSCGGWRLHVQKDRGLLHEGC